MPVCRRCAALSWNHLSLGRITCSSLRLSVCPSLAPRSPCLSSPLTICLLFCGLSSSQTQPFLESPYPAVPGRASPAFYHNQGMSCIYAPYVELPCAQSLVSLGRERPPSPGLPVDGPSLLCSVLAPLAVWPRGTLLMVHMPEAVAWAFPLVLRFRPSRSWCHAFCLSCPEL